MVTAEAEAGVKSGVPEAALTVFVICPEASVRATSVTTARVLEAMSPRLQLTELLVTLHEPIVLATETNPSAGGRLSVRIAPLAVSGPRLVTWIV